MFFFSSFLSDMRNRTNVSRFILKRIRFVMKTVLSSTEFDARNCISFMRLGRNQRKEKILNFKCFSILTVLQSNETGRCIRLLHFIHLIIILSVLFCTLILWEKSLQSHLCVLVVFYQFITFSLKFHY